MQFSPRMDTYTMAVSLHPQQNFPFSGSLPTKAADTGKYLPDVFWKWTFSPYPSQNTILRSGVRAVMAPQ